MFLILNNANLQDRAVLAMWSEKCSLSSITTPRFLAVFEVIMVDEMSVRYAEMRAAIVRSSGWNER